MKIYHITATSGVGHTDYGYYSSLDKAKSKMRELFNDRRKRISVVDAKMNKDEQYFEFMIGGWESAHVQFFVHEIEVE